MGTAERRTRHRASLREEILDAARTLFVEEGYDAVSMRKVAQRIEYSPTTIYLHFKDKGELFAAITDDMFAGLSRKLEALIKKGGDPVMLLREGLRIYAKFALQHKEHYTVAFLLPDHPGGTFEGSAAEHAFNFLRACVTRCVEAHAFRPIDIETTAQSLWTAVHGIVALIIAKANFPFVKHDRLINETLDTMMRGLRA